MTVYAHKTHEGEGTMIYLTRAFANRTKMEDWFLAEADKIKRKRYAPPLTDRQQELYDFIVRCIETTGASPTVKEMMEATGLKSTGYIAKALDLFEFKGLIERRYNRKRGITLAQPDSDASVLSDQGV